MEIIIGGDFFPGYRWEDYAIHNPEEIFSNDLKFELSKADYRIVNLETPLTTSSEPITKTGPCLKCDPQVVNSLKYLDVDLVTLANNHIYDYGEKGLIETLEKLDENNIKSVGAGLDIKSASTPSILNDEVVILNYGQNEWGASEENTSGFNPYSIIDCCRDILKYKEQGYFVIVVNHLGHEGFEYPSPLMQKDFRFLIENKADIVIAHHSHFATGYEKYKGGHIFYGLGNMLFDSKTSDSRWHQSFLLRIKVSDKQLKNFEILPIENHFGKGLSFLVRDKKKDFLNKIEEYSQVITNPKILNDKWLNFVDHQYISYYIALTKKNRYIPGLLRRFPFLKFLFIKSQDVIIPLNLIRCEALNELSVEVLKKAYNAK